MRHIGKTDAVIGIPLIVKPITTSAKLVKQLWASRNRWVYRLTEQTTTNA